MYHLKLGYEDVVTMPWDYFEWFHNRHAQHLIDLEKEQKEAMNKFG